MTFSDCADTTTPTYWLGRPGDLVAVRMPDEGYARSANDHASVHGLLAGVAVDRTPYEQRAWSVTYDFVDYATLLLIEQVRTRQRGLGPYAWIDPHTVNFLTQNQSSGTDAWLNTDGFTVTGTGESLTSSTDITAVRGQRSLLWNLSPAVTGSGGGGVMSLSTPYGPSGWATPPSQGWTFTGQVQGGGTDAIVTVTPRLLFLDVNGNVVGSAVGTAIVTAAGTWTSWLVTGTATAATAYVVPQLVITPGSVSAAVKLYWDEMQLDMRIDSRGPRAWQPGQGQPRVSVLAGSEAVRRVGRTDVAYQLLELTTSM
jgi:hypothetical protein